MIFKGGIIVLRKDTRIEPFSDVRVLSSIGCNSVIPQQGGYSLEDIKTFTYNADTVFPGNDIVAAEILENGKNPGLGIRSLHKRGITGKGVKLAIIDQNLAQPFHPEYSKRLLAYEDIGTKQPSTSGSMHGPAVASLLVGQSCGVAPNAELYFVAVPSWTSDSKYYADALMWIIKVNRSLPASDKIRAVSISAAPSGIGSPFKQNLEMWDKAVSEAKADGLLVLDCRVGCDTGIIAPGYFDSEHPDDITQFCTGFPPNNGYSHPRNVIFAPSSFRTTAEQYTSEKVSYQYTGRGGLSWGIPYAIGVLALGWQIIHSLSNTGIIDLLFDSAYINGYGEKVINPPAFIELIESRLR